MKKKFSCPHCGKRFKKESGLKVHYKAKHDPFTSKEKYYNLVNRITKSMIPELFFRWDGRCKYTGKKLLLNGNPNNPLYRTIDHIIPISYGFKNKIPVSIIGSLANLCICSYEANLKKGKTFTLLERT